ncbi:MAG TPA: dihydrodipicolinate synthase family protein [Gammaproteobacteria bacterium]|nr:dihydrodipicolinate synthase family protein [Gammaproteobacteria bacterium]
MKTSGVTIEDLQRSVLAVPPLARRADLTLEEAENNNLIRYLEQGGISTLMYGGNANFYHIPVSEYESTLAFLARAVADDTWVIPSFGPDYGRLVDQAAILQHTAFPTAMALPQPTTATAGGIVAGLQEAVQRFGRPIILYIKHDRYLSAATVGRLVANGSVVAVKYAVVRDRPAEDAYLGELVAEVGAQRVISGIGERPVIAHFETFGLRAFTSGSVCIAPNLSMAILAALTRRDVATAQRLREAFLPLEDQRDAINPARVLHEAVRLCRIADTGPVLPLLDNLSPAEQARVAPPAQALFAEARHQAAAG